MGHLPAITFSYPSPPYSPLLQWPSISCLSLPRSHKGEGIWCLCFTKPDDLQICPLFWTHFEKCDFTLFYGMSNTPSYLYGTCLLIIQTSTDRRIGIYIYIYLTDIISVKEKEARVYKFGREQGARVCVCARTRTRACVYKLGVGRKKGKGETDVIIS